MPKITLILIFLLFIVGCDNKYKQPTIGGNNIFITFGKSANMTYVTAEIEIKSLDGQCISKALGTQTLKPIITNSWSMRPNTWHRLNLTFINGATVIYADYLRSKPYFFMPRKGYKYSGEILLSLKNKRSKLKLYEINKSGKRKEVKVYAYPKSCE
ncbi:MAG: hypothetical protein QM493_07430 [Sulfurovum sp.]